MLLSGLTHSIDIFTLDLVAETIGLLAPGLGRFSGFKSSQSDFMRCAMARLHLLDARMVATCPY